MYRFCKRHLYAVRLLCVTDNFQRFDNPRKFACYCGVAPF
ncbi:transposase, partial [Bacteroides thetaiotaomicron]